MTREQLEHYLAMVTIAMPIVLAGAHGLRRLAAHLHAHALSTADKRDDKVTRRILDAAMWIDVAVIFIATAASGGLNRTPGIERAEEGDES